MISARNALSRQVQGFFHSHLLGIYKWDDVDYSPPQKIEKLPGKPREAGKTHDKIEMRFGPFDLTVLGPFEDPNHPCGLITIEKGTNTVTGPLDPTTWDRVSKFIREHNEEYHGIEAGDNWGR